MKKLVLIFAFVLPLLGLVCLALYRKHGVNGGEFGLTPSGVGFMPGNALRRSYDIWTNRPFMTVKEDDEAFRTVETLVSSLPISEKIRSNAVQSCVGLIKAYGRGDWEAFLSSRTPDADYEINPKAVKALEFAVKYYNVTNVAEVTTVNAMDIYHLCWRSLVKTNGLFSDVSFISNSITLVKISPNYLEEIGAPSFTAETNRNLFKINPTSIVDYRANLLAQQPKEIQALRFFFFGKTGQECNYYMFVLALNEQSGVWIPWRLCIGYAGDIKHKVTVF